MKIFQVGSNMSAPATRIAQKSFRFNPQDISSLHLQKVVRTVKPELLHSETSQASIIPSRFLNNNIDSKKILVDQDPAMVLDSLLAKTATAKAPTRVRFEDHLF